VQIDIKTAQVTPLRSTFSHVARHFGGDRPASRYLEATLGLQPTANFHYRPLWQPAYHLYDERRTRIRMRDWYALKDPRQFYYGTYTMARARQQDAMERSLEFVERRQLLAVLPDAMREALTFALIPLRHVEWGANANNCFITGYGYGTAITQAAMFCAIDRLGIAQHLSRIGLLLRNNSPEALSEAKAHWMSHRGWQGLRRLAEKLLVTRDWFELHVAQNLALDGLLYPLVFRRYLASIDVRHAPAVDLLCEFMSQWFDETSRWVDATIKTASAESGENARILRDWADEWRSAARAALTPYIRETMGAEGERALDEVAGELDERLRRTLPAPGRETATP
jgi:phenol/toluene 2-monooxygenase (NADH) P1/A1